MANEVKTIEHEETQLRAMQTPMAMIRTAISTNASIEVISKLMDLQERYEKNEARKAFDAAMAAAKAALPEIKKNRHVGFKSKKQGASDTSYWHETLDEILRTIEPILGQHGLSIRFRTVNEPNLPIVVTCRIAHRDGYFEENTLQGPKDETGNKNSLQGIGSTVTYLSRYTLKASLGLAASRDDDGESSEDTGPISEEQAANIRKIIEETEAVVEKVCAFMGVEAITDIPASDYQKCLDGLEEWRRKFEAGKKQTRKAKPQDEEIPF